MLVDRYSRYVYAITRSFSLREHDAEDVFQDVFARAYERLDTLRDADSLRPWLAQLTRRLCIDKIRAGSREQPGEEERRQVFSLRLVVAGLRHLGDFFSENRTK